MNGIISFMQSYFGRIVRVLLGLALIYAGVALVGGSLGIAIAIIGVLPIAMGIWGPCLLGFVKPSHA